jgi:type IV secretion system protein VirB10
MNTTTQDPMSPDASPGEMSKNAGVRRVNNMPMFIVGGLMSVFLVVMVLVAVDRAEKQNRPAEEKEGKAGSTSLFAQEITGDQLGGIIQAQGAAPLEVPPVPGAIAIARPDNLDAPPTPPSSSKNQNQELQRSSQSDELARLRQLKMQQLEEAIKAKTSVNATALRSGVSTGADSNGGGNSGAPVTPLKREDQLARLAAVRQQIDRSSQGDPTAAYKARLQQIQAANAGHNAASEDSTAPRLVEAGAGPHAMTPFADSGQGDRWKLDSRAQAPRTPYELRAGFVVPATLISGINSELPGQIVAQVSQNVFDTATGKWRLIPQGSRLVGSYSSSVAYGQGRVLVAWQRIIFPDGKAMDIGAMPGADSAGYAGLNDQVNNHYVRLFASAFLMSGVTAGVSLSQPQQTTGTTTPTAGSAMSEALGQQLGQVTAQLIAKNMNIAPTLEIRPGYRFNVIVTKDMTFTKPYQAFDY